MTYWYFYLIFFFFLQTRRNSINVDFRQAYRVYGKVKSKKGGRSGKRLKSLLFSNTQYNFTSLLSASSLPAFSCSYFFPPTPPFHFIFRKTLLLYIYIYLRGWSNFRFRNRITAEVNKEIRIGVWKLENTKMADVFAVSYYKQFRIHPIFAVCSR